MKPILKDWLEQQADDTAEGITDGFVGTIKQDFIEYLEDYKEQIEFYNAIREELNNPERPPFKTKDWVELYESETEEKLK